MQEPSGMSCCLLTPVLQRPVYRYRDEQAHDQRYEHLPYDHWVDSSSDGCDSPVRSQVFMKRAKLTRDDDSARQANPPSLRGSDLLEL